MKTTAQPQEYRTLHGLPRPSSVLVDGSDIGTDPLFYSAGTLTEVGLGTGSGLHVQVHKWTGVYLLLTANKDRGAGA